MPATTINERFLDYQVAQAIRWIRFGNRQSKIAMQIMGGVDQQLKRLLLDPPGGEYTQARLVALKTQIESLMTTVHDGEIKPMIEDMVKDVAMTVGDQETSTFKRILPAGLDVTTPNLGVLQTAVLTNPFQGATVDEWIAELGRNDLNRVWRTTLDGIIQGKTTDALVRDVIGSQSLRYKDGVREVSRRGMDALIRTSITHATNVGRQAVWEANDDLVSAVRWVSTLDSRTTPICRDLDGQTWPVNDGPRPPAHLRCRSTTVAVLKSWKELGYQVDELPAGTRAAMDGQVPSDLTYWDWFKQTDESNQEEVLGPSRFKMWKDGTIPDPTEFTNDQGRLYTLEELKRRHG